MRAGTQTLIQALQAIPWAEDQDNEDDMLHAEAGAANTETESDEDDRPGMCASFLRMLHSRMRKSALTNLSVNSRSLATRMASSIHTIYRPLARSKRDYMPSLLRSRRISGREKGKGRELPSVLDVENEDEVVPVLAESAQKQGTQREPLAEEPIMSSEEEDGEDFEPMRSSPESSIPEMPGSFAMGTGLQLSVPLPALGEVEKDLPGSPSTAKAHPSRSGSMATVKLQRRARLAEKLRDIFEIEGIEEVITGACTRSRMSNIDHVDDGGDGKQRCRVGFCGRSVSGTFSVLRDCFAERLRAQCSRATCTSLTLMCVSSLICLRERCGGLVFYCMHHLLI